MAEDRTADEIKRALLTDYLATFGTGPGQRVLEHLRSVAYFSRTTVHRLPTGGSDLLLTGVNEGARMLVAGIMANLKAAAQLGQELPMRAVTDTEENAHAR